MRYHMALCTACSMVTGDGWEETRLKVEVSRGWTRGKIVERPYTNEVQGGGPELPCVSLPHPILPMSLDHLIRDGNSKSARTLS